MQERKYGEKEGGRERVKERSRGGGCTNKSQGLPKWRRVKD